MSNQLNISVLVAAREEYLKQLKKHLTPLIQEGLISIYDDAKEEDPDNPLRQFQIFLKEIPKWNQTILDMETKRIKDRCPFLMDCVTAIFVSNVKILASVRLGGNHSNIRIRIPTAEIFVHSVYIASAETFYYDPEPFEDLLERDNIDKIKRGIDNSIEDTISSMIPIQNILQEYLCNTFTEHVQPPPKPDPLPEPPGDILTGTDIVDPLPSMEETQKTFDKGYESDKSSLSDLFNVGGGGSDFGSVSDVDSVPDTSGEVKEITLGDSVPFGGDTEDKTTEQEPNLFGDTSNNDTTTTAETKDETFNPLGFLGFGGGGDSSSKPEEQGSTAKLDESDFNFFDDSTTNF